MSVVDWHVSSTRSLDVANKKVEDGAYAMDINVDVGMLDGLIVAMQKFVKIAATEPEVA
jgi:cobalamin-dependent methionine synthase I